MSNFNKLSKLEKINIRDIWRSEAKDFTNWLAQEESLALLSNEIGIDVKLISTEASVGAFSADILALEEGTDNKIIIENQLEQTNHDHLGKIITYGSGHNAKYLIWIFKEIKEEHRRAIDWLNEKTNDLYIFAIQMEVWKIGESDPAPKFQIICAPNDWAKTIQKSTDNENITKTNLVQHDFWTNFVAFLKKEKSRLRARKPKPQHWYDLSIGISQMHISCVVSYQNNWINCHIYISDDKNLFKKLYSQKEDIEKALGFSPEWEELPHRKASKIIYKNNVDLNNKDNYDNYYKWLKEIAEKYFEVIPKFIY